MWLLHPHLHHLAVLLQLEAQIRSAQPGEATRLQKLCSCWMKFRLLSVLHPSLRKLADNFHYCKGVRLSVSNCNPVTRSQAIHARFKIRNQGSSSKDFRSLAGIQGVNISKSSHDMWWVCQSAETSCAPYADHPCSGFLPTYGRCGGRRYFYIYQWIIFTVSHTFYSPKTTSCSQSLHSSTKSWLCWLNKRWLWDFCSIAVKISKFYSYLLTISEIAGWLGRERIVAFQLAYGVLCRCEYNSLGWLWFMSECVRYMAIWLREMSGSPI